MPSFLDRFMAAVNRLPGPYWLTYLLLFLLESFILHIAAWADGWLPVYTVSPLPLLYPVWLWGPLTIMTYLNSVSLKALSNFRPLLKLDDEQFNRLKYEFTTMPPRGVFFSGLFWCIVYVGLNYVSYDAFFVKYGLGPLGMVVTFLSGLLSFATVSAVYYHALRQLSLVNRTVMVAQSFNLFRIEPVYAFSRLTSQTGISWMIMLSLTLLLYPFQIANMLVLAILIFQVGLALAAFVLPLRVVNRRLVAGKRRLLAEFNQRLESLLDRLHRFVDGNTVEDVYQLESAMNALSAEREILNRIPTWPWRAGTLTGFLSAIVLPIVLFVVQLIIAKLMSG
jgi:hypothetical protein